MIRRLSVERVHFAEGVVYCGFIGAVKADSARHQSAFFRLREQGKFNIFAGHRIIEPNFPMWNKAIGEVISAESKIGKNIPANNVTVDDPDFRAIGQRFKMLEIDVP